LELFLVYGRQKGLSNHIQKDFCQLEVICPGNTKQVLKIIKLLGRTLRFKDRFI